MSLKVHEKRGRGEAESDALVVAAAAELLLNCCYKYLTTNEPSVAVLAAGAGIESGPHEEARSSGQQELEARARQEATEGGLLLALEDEQASVRW